MMSNITMINEELIQNMAQYEQEVITLRRHFHKYPELGFEEFETAKFIEKYLNDLGIPTQRMAKTGVVGLIDSGKAGKTVLLRADMDALPIQEKNTFSYCSANMGVMHACGHDGHIAMLLVAAKILMQKKDLFCGKIKLVFQPNEEDAGACYMVEEGVLQNPKVDASFALHLWTPIASGKIGLKSGAVMAEMYNFKITLRGTGGHTSAPHLGIDPVVCAANIIQSLQSIQTRELNPMEATVIMIGKVAGGTAPNVMAEEMTLEGNLRYLYDGGDNSEQNPRKRMERIVKGIAQAHRVECDIAFFPSNYIVMNDENSVDFLKKNVLSHIVGDDDIVEYCCMGGEDFSEFTNHNNIPGALIFIGTGNETVGSHYPHHTATFTIDENTLMTGVKTHVLTAIQYLQDETYKI